jgi:glucokinase
LNAVGAVGVDVGGTKIAAGLVTPEGKLLNETRYSTADEPEKLLDSLARAVGEAAKDGVEAACLAVPGLILASEDKVIFSPNLHAIEGLYLKSELESRTGLTITVENDANAAAWGEFVFGAGREVENLVFLTLGTGVGGGVIVEGQLLRGSQGAGGELGHTTLHATGPRCNCGNRGCFEIMASGLAIERRARELAAEKPDSDLAKVVTDTRGFSGEQITELASEDDALAISILRETGVWLGIGIAGFVNVFNPEAVAIGGGVAEAGELILESARREVHLRARSPSRDLAEIKPATLGGKSGMLGAAALARNASGETVLEAG